MRDFPDGPVVKDSTLNARFAGSIPGQGTKIPHAKESKKLKTKYQMTMNRGLFRIFQTLAISLQSSLGKKEIIFHLNHAKTN